MSTPEVTCQTDGPSGRRWAAGIAALSVATTLIPYVMGYMQSRGRRFMWLGYNLDDSCVYLSWMRQAADGAVRTLNLFTTDSQHGMAPNLFFWLLGRTAAVTHLPLIGVFHGARIVCGFILLLVVWEFIRAAIQNERARQLAYLFVCFASGLGWLPIWWNGPLPAPIDMWQPEAITFLSLYLSPLFCFSMCLQVAILHLLLLGERTGQMRYALWAGICGFVLGMTHTYDVITMAAVWCAFMVVVSIIRLRTSAPIREITVTWLRGGVAGLITAPAVLYIAYQLRTEAVFRARANVETLTPGLHWILWGYGLLFALGILGAVICTTERLSQELPVSGNNGRAGAKNALILLVVWAVVNIAVAYVPVTFQRKLMQGAHFPISMLAGIGGEWLWRQYCSRALRGKFYLFGLLAVGVLCPTNVLFMVRDTNNFSGNVSQTKIHRPYLQPGEIAALEWLKNNTAPGTAVQPLPWVGHIELGNHNRIFPSDTALMCFTPGLIDRPVYCGHWGETPHFQDKLAKLTSLGTRFMADADRVALLNSMGVKYLVFSQKRGADTNTAAIEDADTAVPMFRGCIPLPSYLILRYSNQDADVYEIRL